MSISRFLFSDAFQDAVITSNTEATDFPKENIQNELRTKTSRTTDAVGEWWTFYLGATPKIINSIALVGGNLFSEMADINILANPTDSWGSPALAETISQNTQLMSNGTFDSDTTGWTPGNATLASVAGGESGNAMTITRTGGSSQSATQTITGLKIGRRYILSGYAISGSSGDEGFQIKAHKDGVDLAFAGNTTTTGTWTIYSTTFISQFTSIEIHLVKNSATAGNMGFDTIKLFEIPESDMLIHYLAADSHYPWWRLSIDKGSGSYFELGRIMGGLYTAPSRGIVHGGFSKGLSDLTTISRTPGGQAHSDFKTIYNDLSLKYSLMSATDRDRVESMYRNNRLSKNMIVHADPTDPDKAFYAKFAERPKFAEDSDTGTLLYNYDLKFSESP